MGTDPPPVDKLDAFYILSSSEKLTLWLNKNLDSLFSLIIGANIEL